MADAKTSALPAVAAAAAAQELPCNDAGTSKKVTLAQVRTLIETLLSQLTVDNLRLDGNVLSSVDTDGHIVLVPNGDGMICFYGATADDCALHHLDSFDGGPGIRLVNPTFSAGHAFVARALGVPNDTAPTALISSNIIVLGNGSPIAWTNDVSAIAGSRDVGLGRLSAGIVDITDGSTGRGGLRTAGLQTSISTKTANYTLTAADHTVLFDTTGGALTATLPAAADHVGRLYVLKNIGAGINALTVDGDGSETIDGLTTQTVPLLGALIIQSTGTAWVVLGSV